MRRMLFVPLLALLILFSGCAEQHMSAQSSTAPTSPAATDITIIPTTTPSETTSAVTESTEPDDTEPTEPTPESDIGIAPMHLFPFVYSKNHWSLKQLDTSNCVSGYLYVHNRQDDSIIQILDEQVAIFTETSKFLYCITMDGHIIQTDYEGSLYRELYTYTRGYYPCIEYKDGRIVFMDGFHVIVMDASTGEWQDVGEAPGMNQVFPASENYLLMKDPDGKFYGFDIRTAEIIGLSTEQMVSDLLDGYWPGEKPDELSDPPTTEPEFADETDPT